MTNKFLSTKRYRWVVAGLTGLLPCGVAGAQTYVDVQGGYTADSRLASIEADENLNYPSPATPDLLFTSDVSTLRLEESFVVGFKVGHIFATGVGVELDAYTFKPDLLQQDVTITLTEPVSIDGEVFDDFSFTENQLPGSIRLWVFDPTVTYNFDLGRIQPYVGAGLSIVISDVSADGTSCRLVAEFQAFGEFVSQCPAPRFSSTDVSIGWSLKAGARYRVDDHWTVGLEYKFNRFDNGTDDFRSLQDIDGSIRTNVFVASVGRRF